MIRRTLITGTAALLVGASLLIAPASSEAKSCSALCKSAIAECKSSLCTGLKKKDKRTCFKTTCRRTLLNECKALSKPRTACSPSGAFLE